MQRDWENKTKILVTEIFNYQEPLSKRLRALKELTNNLCGGFITFQTLNMPLLTLECVYRLFREEKRRICLDEEKEQNISEMMNEVMNNLAILAKTREITLRFRETTFNTSACFKERAEALNKLLEHCLSGRIFLPEVFLGEEPIIKLAEVLQELRSKAIEEINRVARGELSRNKLPSLHWVELCLNRAEQDLNKLRGRKTILFAASFADIVASTLRF